MRLILLALCSAAVLAGQAARFSEDNRLLLPEDYRTWPLAGASLGLSYNEDGEASGEPQFHQVYLDPAAYAEYTRSGTFPDGTVLMMEVYSKGSNPTPNRAGSFADRFLRVEAAVKVSGRFAQDWVYFDFGGPRPEQVSTEAFAAKSCWTCHNEHAAEDNVFTQFYGPLRAARSTR